MENPYIIKYFEMMTIELEKMARGMILWNNFTYEGIFPNLSEEKMTENIYDTYKNIIDSRENLGEQGQNTLEKISQYLCSIIEKWSLEEDMERLIEEVRYKRANKVTMKTILDYLCNSIDKMKDNYLIIFMENIVNMDFDTYVEDEYLLDSLKFIQKIVKIFNGVRAIHKKRKLIMREKMNLSLYVKHRRYF